MDEAAARVRFGVSNHTEKLAELRNQITEKELQLEDALSNSDIALAKQCKEEKEALEAELEKQTKKRSVRSAERICLSQRMMWQMLFPAGQKFR